MASITETTKTELGAGLAAGIETLSLNQEITFTLYVKTVLPLDGYVFWVNAALLTDSALYDAAQYNRLEYNRESTPLPKRTVKAKGSMHYITETQMHEDRNISVNNMVFTSLTPIQDLNEVNPQLMYVGNFDGERFAFSRRDSFYKQADLYHYKGHALYSTMQTQVIDNVNQLDLDTVIVSNSLPIWLTLNKYFPVFPSYLINPNDAPPYAAVHIEPSKSEAIQAAPRIFPNSSYYQLTKDSVKITIYGARNFTALEYLDYVLDYSLNYNTIGMMNMPVVQDEKATQTEFGTIAIKKTINFEVSYYQQNIRDVAIQYIRSAFINVDIQ